MSRKAKHRAKWHLLRYPLGAYIVQIKNRWYAFIKPAIRQRVKEYKKGN